MLGASRHLGQTPLPRYNQTGPGFINQAGTHMAGTQLQVRGGALQVFCSYNKGGPDPTILAELLRRTNAGASPFIFFGDLNANVDDPVVPDWARRLRAKILKPSCGTCFARAGRPRLTSLFKLMAWRGLCLNTVWSWRCLLPRMRQLSWSSEWISGFSPSGFSRRRGNYPLRPRAKR